ncbi:MAG: site-specific DNA-methyltransferase [Roseburia sp.]|nr:site-specific DNA-methyltransferase [Roseburia sp.]
MLGSFELNQIYCADAYNAIRELPGNSVDLVYTDIPYDFEGNGGGGCFGEKKRDYHKEYEKISENTAIGGVYKRALACATKNSNIAFGIDYGILDEFCRVLKAIYVYIWCSKKQIPPLIDYFVNGKDCRFEILTWHKTNPIPTCNNKYLSDTEYCLMFREEGTYIGGNMKSKGKYWLSPLNTFDKKRLNHPTIKPLQFVQNHIFNSTKEGDIVLDPFCGSGTTCLAAKNLGRQYLGFDIQEKWAKIAQDRLNGIDANGQQSFILF